MVQCLIPSRHLGSYSLMWIFSLCYYQGTDFGIWFGRAWEVCASRYEAPSQKAGRPVLCDEVELGDTGTYSVHRGQSDHCHLLFVKRMMMKYPILTSFGFSTKLHLFIREPSNVKIALSSIFHAQLLWKQKRETVIILKLILIALCEDFMTIRMCI